MSSLGRSTISCSTPASARANVSGQIGKRPDEYRERIRSYLTEAGYPLSAVEGAIGAKISAWSNEQIASVVRTLTAHKDRILTDLDEVYRPRAADAVEATPQEPRPAGNGRPAEPEPPERTASASAAITAEAPPMPPGEPPAPTAEPQAQPGRPKRPETIARDIISRDRRDRPGECGRADAASRGGDRWAAGPSADRGRDRGAGPADGERRGEEEIDEMLDEFALWRELMAADMAARPREMLVGAKAHWLRLGVLFGEDAAAAVQAEFEARQAIDRTGSYDHDEATFDACLDALMTLTPYSEESVNAALRDLAEEFPGRVWEPVELVDAVQVGSAASLPQEPGSRPFPAGTLRRGRRAALRADRGRRLPDRGAAEEGAAR